MQQMKQLLRLGIISRIQLGSYSTLNELLLKMPKEMKHTVTLRNQRLKVKEKRQKYSPGTVTLQVIGSGAKGAPRSLYVFTDQSRYLFNCGEGTQRLAHEHKMKLSKLEHIFFTQASWENIGGLPGVALTIQDVGVPEITLHGPEGIEEIFPATKRFVVLRNLQVNTANCLETSNFEDNAIIVKYIPISIENENKSPKYVESLDEDDIDYYAYERNSRSVISRKISPRFIGDCGKRVMCYAVKLQPKLGSLCLEKCVEAGVLPGPLFGLLKAGKDIVLPDGRVVRSSDVTMPTQNGPTFLVVECPSKEFLEPFTSKTAFEKYQCHNNPKLEDVPFVIVHFTPPDILNEQLYRNWINKFPASTKHLVFNSSNTCLGSAAVHRIQYKLNMMDDYIFPLLNYTEKRLDDNEFCVINAKTFYNVNLRPKQEIELQTGLKLYPEEYLKEAKAIEGFVSKLDELKTKLVDFEEPSTNYPNFIFLGTGSCIPNKTRNTSAILVNLSEDSYILLDCGEGTYGQMVRFFGPSQVDDVMSKLKAVYISHLHADHHLGLVGMLKAHNKLKLQKPIYLLAPKQIMYWLNLYDRHFEEIMKNVQLFPNSDMVYTDFNLGGESVNKLKDIGFDKINTTYVKHCPNSFGVTLKHKNGWKVTYSGDTMPCESLIKIGEGSDLLIHEATMEDELEPEAKIKLHSTTSQAIEMGEKMGAKYTLLTHFSQRYAKLPRLDSELKENVGIAFDNMRVRLTDLHKLNLMYPAMKLMFIEDCDELELKSLKRQRKQEREEIKRQKTQTVL